MVRKNGRDEKETMTSGDVEEGSNEMKNDEEASGRARRTGGGGGTGEEATVGEWEDRAGQGGGPAPADPEAPESGEATAGLDDELAQLQEEMDELRDQHLRLAAEFENYRKRVTGEMAGRWDRAQADLVGKLADGLDDLRRVSEFTSDDTTVEALIEGVDLVERKLLKALVDAGLEVLDPIGEAFDPNVMEAMMRVPTEGEGQDETVHQVLQKGYLFKDILVRPARVSVYKDEE
jgi:molecular chaperone GrpE